jgi:formylglycine-generating enzyme
MSMRILVSLVLCVAGTLGCAGGSESASKKVETAQIPAGTFIMGSDKDEDSDEYPAHSVSVKAFEMDVTEVTAAAYQACLDAGECTDAYTDEDTCNAGVSARSQHPINCVDWD